MSAETKLEALITVAQVAAKAAAVAAIVAAKASDCAAIGVLNVVQSRSRAADAVALAADVAADDNYCDARLLPGLRAEAEKGVAATTSEVIRLSYAAEGTIRYADAMQAVADRAAADAEAARASVAAVYRTWRSDGL